MSLIKDDLHEISKIIQDLVVPPLQELLVWKDEMNEWRQDVSSDLRSLKTDLAMVQCDLAYVKYDVKELKEGLKNLEKDHSVTVRRVKKLELIRT